MTQMVARTATSMKILVRRVVRPRPGFSLARRDMSDMHFAWKYFPPNLVLLAAILGLLVTTVTLRRRKRTACFTPSAPSPNARMGLVPRALWCRTRMATSTGTTGVGGVYNSGTVFEITSSGTEKVLYSFTGGADGAWPQGPLVLDAEGNLYGTTAAGGLQNGCQGYGCGSSPVRLVSNSDLCCLHQ
jgi:hypothetical protein